MYYQQVELLRFFITTISRYIYKKIIIPILFKKAIVRDGEKIIRFANEEGLTAHANSIKVRLNNEEDK